MSGFGITSRIPWLVCGGLVLTAAVSHAQPGRPKAEVTPLVERPGVHAGEPVRLALRVSLPEGLHTQSNKPRDPTLIPTALTIDAPAGVTVTEIVFPPSTDLKQAGIDEPLAVFEHEFAIGIQVTLAPAVLPGALAIPGHLRYQACDANLCYPPATADVRWTVNVVRPSVVVDGDRNGVFGQIAFGHGNS